MLITHLHRKRSGHWIDSAPGIIGLGVAIILFEGGKDLKLGEFRRVGHGVGRLNKESASLLKWEGIVNEPVGVLPAVLTLQYFTNAGSGWQQAVLGLGMAILAAAVFGGLGGLDHLPALSPRIRTRPP